ncbi:hypothetical protein FQR65_LT11188 [Abscondita terminalis]|nr:hypothetical protein FQR65_LT11188 [Abscondita terminalis]
MQSIRFLYKILKYPLHVSNFRKLFATTQTLKNIDYKRFYEVLNIPENSDQENIRKAYLAMVKRYHPDSSSNEADADKFQEVDHAYRMLMDKMAMDRWQVDEVEVELEDDLKHVAPQHRHYLSYDGIGYGNQYQRQKQYAQTRAVRASENVMKHRIDKSIKDDNAIVVKRQSHKIKTKYGFDRLVEDLIQEAISKGEFNNLSGRGKPLPDINIKNPHVDFVTHKLNEVLISNGFKPEWITLQQEIRIDMESIRKALIIQRANVSPCPLTVEEYDSWSNLVEKFAKPTEDVNKKILKYNLLVPILNRQMMFMNLEKEAKKILLHGQTNKNVTEYLKKREIEKEKKKQGGFYTFFLRSLFE